MNTMSENIEAVLHDLRLEGFEPENDLELMADLEKLKQREITLDDLIEDFRRRHHID